MPYKDPMGYTKEYTIYSTNAKMNKNHDYTPEFPIEVMEHGWEVEVKQVGGIEVYKYGGEVKKKKKY